MMEIHICSFVDEFVEYEYKGRTYRWEFSSMFGPLFVNQDWEPRKHQPVGPRGKHWEAFCDWWDKATNENKRNLNKYE